MMRRSRGRTGKISYKKYITENDQNVPVTVVVAISDDPFTPSRGSAMGPPIGYDCLVVWATIFNFLRHKFQSDRSAFGWIPDLRSVLIYRKRPSAELADTVRFGIGREIMPLVVVSFPLKPQSLPPSTNTMHGALGRFFSPIAFA